MIMERTPYFKFQHLYFKGKSGKSTKTALYDIICTIELSLHDKQYTLAAFLVNIQGAFNDIGTKRIKEALARICL